MCRGQIPHNHNEITPERDKRDQNLISEEPKLYEWYKAWSNNINQKYENQK